MKNLCPKYRQPVKIKYERNKVKLVDNLVCINSKHPLCRVCRGETKTLQEALDKFNYSDPVKCSECMFCESYEEKLKCPQFREELKCQK